MSYICCIYNLTKNYLLNSDLNANIDFDFRFSFGIK